MPYVERTVQDYGIRIDDIFYYSDVIRVWVNATVEGRSKLKRKFICRRDPRDISKIWFFDPQLKCYLSIPYRDTSRPSMTKWELQAIQKRLKEEGKSHVNEDMIFEALETMRRIEKLAVEKTKKARRTSQRRKVAKETSLPSKSQQDVVNQLSIQSAEQADMDEEDDIQPFEEMIEVRRDD